MDKLNFVFLIREDNHWEQLFSHIANLSKQVAMTDKIVVVAVGTALLSCLKSTRMETVKSAISQLNKGNVEFYLCGNTLSKYGIDEDFILPEIKIAHEGGLLKVACLESVGYHNMTLG